MHGAHTIAQVISNSSFKRHVDMPLRNRDEQLHGLKQQPPGGHGHQQSIDSAVTHNCFTGEARPRKAQIICELLLYSRDSIGKQTLLHKCGYARMQHSAGSNVEAALVNDVFAPAHVTRLRVRRRRRAGMTFSIDNAYAHVRPPPGLAAPAPPGRALA